MPELVLDKISYAHADLSLRNIFTENLLAQILCYTRRCFKRRTGIAENIFREVICEWPNKLFNPHGGATISEGEKDLNNQSVNYFSHLLIVIDKNASRTMPQSARVFAGPALPRVG
jgi:hypothetical protein